MATDTLDCLTAHLGYMESLSKSFDVSCILSGPRFKLKRKFSYALFDDYSCLLCLELKLVLRLRERILFNNFTFVSPFGRSHL